MKAKAVLAITLTLLMLTSILMLAFNIRLIKASGTIYIRVNGKVDPDTAPIQRDNNLYTFADSIYDSIVVERDNVVVDGAGYTLQGTGTVSSKGLDLSERSNITIKNMEIKAFEHGIDLSGSSNNIIQGNTMTNNSYGLWLLNSPNNTISDNNITNNWDGIELYESSNNSISGNNIANNVDGIGIDWSPNNVLRDNSLAENEHNFRLWGGTVSSFVSDIDASNTIDGKPIYYWIGKQAMSVPLDAGYIALVDCTRITVQNLNLSNNGQGALLAHTTNSTITKNSITNNEYGVHLVYSSNNVISENAVTYNTRGVFLDDKSDSNSLTGNNMTNNSYGIWLDKSSNNKLYHNLIDNTQQVCILGFGYANIWDDGYPSGGNFWRDYTGQDLDKDSIGDTSYIIDDSNQDRYPLMSLYGEFLGDTPPVISILSPENKTYSANDVSLAFTVSEPTSWIGYSLDGLMNVTITGNTTLSGLSEGSHSLVVYANDTTGNVGYSQSVYFSTETPQGEPFPMWVVVTCMFAVVMAIIAGIALVAYLRPETFRRLART